MSDAVVEISSQPVTENPAESIKPISPEKSQLISQALERFDRVRDGARSLGFMDQQFGERLGSGLRIIEADVNNASPREVGAREANQLAANLSESLRPQLRRIVQEGEVLGLGTDPIRAELEDILQQAASETDPIKAFSLASKAVERFHRFSDGEIQKRGVQRAAEQQVGSGIQENQQRANYIYHRVEDQLRMQLENGTLDRFRSNSGRLLRTAEEAFQSLSKADRVFLEETDQGKVIFKKIVDSLIRNDLVPAPEIAEALQTKEFSLKDYANTEVPSFNKALQKIGVNSHASIVFGSAVHPSEASASIKLNPQRWDVDILEIVDSIASLREKPDQVLLTDSGKRYGCIVPPSGGVAELQEIGSMGIKSPKRGLHITIMEESELLNGDLEPMVRKALETGVIIDGQIPESIRNILERAGVPMPKKPDEVVWSALKYSTPSNLDSNRRII